MNNFWQNSTVSESYKHKNYKLGSIKFNMKNIFLLLLSSILMASCAVSKKMVPPSPPALRAETAFLRKNLGKNNLSVAWFSSKIGLNFESEAMSFSGIVNVRMRSDSVIWLNVTKFGIEVARALITPDSCVVLNRIDGTYAVENWDFIAQKIGLPNKQANFKNLQHLILGNTIEMVGQEFSSDTLGGVYHLQIKNNTDHVRTAYILSASDLLMEQMTVEDSTKKSLFVTNNANYAPLEGLTGKQLFSFERANSFRDEKGGISTATMQFEKVDINVPKSLPFEIPSRYSKLNNR